MNQTSEMGESCHWSDWTKERISPSRNES